MLNAFTFMITLRRVLFHHGAIMDSTRAHYPAMDALIAATVPYYGYDLRFYMGRVTFSLN